MRLSHGLAIVIAIVIFIVGAAIGTGVSSWTGRSVFRSSHNIPVYVSQTAAEDASATGMGFAPILKPALPAIVSITSSRLVKVPQIPFFDNPFFQQFFGNQIPRGPRQQRESG